MFYFSHNLTDLHLDQSFCSCGFYLQLILVCASTLIFWSTFIQTVEYKIQFLTFFNPIINVYLIYHAQHSLINWNWILDFKVNAWGLSQNVCPLFTWDSFVSIVTRLHAGQLWSQDFVSCRDDIALFHFVQTSCVVYATSSSMSSRWLFPER